MRRPLLDHTALVAPRMSRSPAPDRADVRRPSTAPPVGRVLVGTALGLLLYEATKSALLPGLTLWQSHAVTIVFGALVAAGGAHRALRTQQRLHDEVLRGMRGQERAQARELSLRESEARYRQLVERSPEAIVVHRGAEVLYANPACLALIGARHVAELPERGLAAYVHPDDVPRLTGRLGAVTPTHGGASVDGPALGRRLVASAGPFTAEYRLRALDGAERVVEAASVGITHDGTPAIQTVLRDVTERKRLERELLYQAFHDPLTGLANRALFFDRVSHALARVARGERLAVLLLDLDHFKHVNDSLGHLAGDELLRLVARRLLTATRGCDTVARLGGDEFAILLESMHHDDDARRVADRVVAAMRAPFTLGGRPVTVGASIGIARAVDARDAAEPADALLRNADLALYAAKAQGRFRHVTFAPAMHDAALHRLELEAELRASVAELATAGEEAPFHLLYQPIVDLATERITGVEALLRWRHPTRGTIAPGEFVPVAEETGLIVPLGRWVLQAACGMAAALDGTEHGVAVAVNVSGHQLRDDVLLADVREALAASGLPPHRLVLEITESVMMREADATLARLRALRTLGVRLAIDDFGTGYSSLAYLRQFPVDILKIDKSFVDAVGQGGDETAIATAILSLGEALSLLTVAEGIEDARQLERLRELGCARGQGYLFARPLEAAALRARLRAQGATGGPSSASSADHA